MEQGHVYLVGAGPGDPGLLTLKGCRALGEAEVVIYDRLANPALLALVPAEAERIYAGKLPHRHTLKQHEINTLLIERARAGQRVVRLKGGDPFVFGRGGEEAEALRAAEIPFDVVPGITSAIAAPAYAGIPVTHREDSSAFAVVTGHQSGARDGKGVDYAVLARVGTLLFLMGVGRLQEITSGLIEAGMDRATPVAIVMWGSHPHQRTVTGTLATIYDRAMAAGIGAPAVIVVGQVARLRETAAWFDETPLRPLRGQRVLLWQHDPASRPLATELERLGAEIDHFPESRVARDALLGGRGLHANGNGAGYPDRDWILFESRDAVGVFWSSLLAGGGDARTLAGYRLVARDGGVVAALENRGLRADLLLGGEGAGLLVATLAREGARRLLLAGNAGDTEQLASGLSVAGIEVQMIPLGDGRASGAKDRSSGWPTGAAIILLTCPGSVAALLEQNGPSLPPDTVIVAANDDVARRAEQGGLPLPIRAAGCSVEAVTATVIEAAGMRQERSQPAGC